MSVLLFLPGYSSHIRVGHPHRAKKAHWGSQPRNTEIWFQIHTAIKLATTWPRAHQTDKKVRRYCLSPGRTRETWFRRLADCRQQRSQYTLAVSGAEGPVRTDQAAKADPVGRCARGDTKMPAPTSVQFHASRRLPLQLLDPASCSQRTHPTTSHDMPQKVAPTINPA